MEPNKLEQDFRNKLEQRTIEPSQMAWDRLDAMLSVTEEKKQPKKRTWMYMAAGFLLFMSVGAFLLQTEKNNSGNVEATVVDAEKPVEAENSGSIETLGIEAVNELVTAPVKEKAGTVALQQNNKAAGKLKKQRQGNRSTNNNTPVMVQEMNVQQEAVAVNEMPENTLGETDKLLAASTDNKTTKNKSSVRVDAGSLLSSVEGELDNSFRHDVLQKIVKNYNTVKTSVANRNYEHK